MYLIFFTQAHIIKDIYTLIHIYPFIFMRTYTHTCLHIYICTVDMQAFWSSFTFKDELIIYTFSVFCFCQDILCGRNSSKSKGIVLNHIYIQLLTSLLHINQHLSSIYNVRAKAWDLFKFQNWKGNKEMNNSALLQNRWEN